MPKLMRKLAITAKTESVYNTDPTPTGAANAMLVRNAKLSPVVLDTEGRVLVLPYLGNDEAIITGSHVMLEFEVEFAGAGAAGTAPKYGPLLLACGFGETISAGVSVVYAPVSASFGSCTIYSNIDGVNFKMTGVRGNVSIDAVSKKIPVFKFQMLGLYNAPADLALPALTLTGWQVPLAVNKANTPTFTQHTYAGVLQSLSLDMKNQIVYRNLVNSESVLLVDREPSGSILFEATDIATKDWYSIVRAASTGAQQLVHGTTAGNIVQIDAPKVQLINPQFSDMDGVQMISFDTRYMPSASGNDELTITVK